MLEYNPDLGEFREIQVISALPEGFDGHSQGGAIHITKDGKFVYASNRGHDSIAVFSVNEYSGELSLVEHVSTEGEWPRDFEIDPSEQFLVASNQETGTLTLFERDRTTGRLTLLESGVPAPEAVCVKFYINKAKNLIGLLASQVFLYSMRRLTAVILLRIQLFLTLINATICLISSSERSVPSTASLSLAQSVSSMASFLAFSSRGSSTLPSKNRWRY